MVTEEFGKKTQAANIEQIDEPLVLLTGHRKCGTSMFHHLFDGHEELCCYPVDLYVLYAYFPHFIGEHHTEDELRARLDKIVCDPLRLSIANHGIEGIDVETFKTKFFARLEGKNIRDPRYVIEAMTNAWRSLAEQNDRRWTVVKETSVDIYAAELFKWFPKMRIIQLVRDPRDNYAALKAGVEKYYGQLGEDTRETLASLLQRALVDMRMALLNKSRFGADRYLVLRFEDVARSTESSMQIAASFLGIKYDSCLLKPTVLGHSTSGNNFEQEQMRSVSAKNVNRWRERITPEEAQIIEFHFSGIMEEFSYQTEYSPAEQADAQAEFYKWANYRYFYKDSFSATSRT